MDEPRIDGIEKRVTALEYREPLEECKKMHDLLKRTLFGNGKPENSIATRLLLLEKKVCRVERLLYLATTLLAGVAGDVVRRLISHGSS